MAALTCPTAPAENWTAVFVYPWFGSPPPQKATSKISAPWLARVSMALIMVCGEANYLRVPSQHNLSVRATGVEAVDRTRRGRDTLLNRTRITGSATRGLTTAGRIADSLSRGARVGREDRIHDGCRAAVAGAGRGLACSKDVDAWTRLALFEFRFAFNGRGIAQKAIASEQEVGSLWAGLHLDSEGEFPR